MFVFPDWLVSDCIFAFLSLEYFFSRSDSDVAIHISKGSCASLELSCFEPKADDIGWLLSERSLKDNKSGFLSVIV